MPSIPLFIVTSIKKGRRQAPKSMYTARNDGEPVWQVKMRSGFFPGVGVTFSYPDENKADGFSPWQICNPSTIIQDAAPAGEPFTVQDIYKTKGYGAKNLYTDKRKPIDNWTVSMAGAYGDYVDLWYPTQGEAFQFGKGRAYTIQDLFGTLRAPLFQMGVQLEAAAQSAQEAQRQADAARKQADQLSYNQQRAQEAANTLAADAQTQAAQEEAQAAANAARQSALDHGASAAVANQVAQSVLENTNSTFYLSQSANNQSVYFWITDGGAAGWYAIGTAQQIGTAANGPGTYAWENNVAVVGHQVATGIGSNPAYTHYARGTFNSPYNGILMGAFASDASVAAGTVQPYY